MEVIRIQKGDWIDSKSNQPMPGPEHLEKCTVVYAVTTDVPRYLLQGYGANKYAASAFAQISDLDEVEMLKERLVYEKV